MIEVVVGLCWAAAGAVAAEKSVLALSNMPAIGTTNERYASWTIDSSYNRGFVHTAFGNPNLIAGATSLAPSTLRFGGGGNDYLHYQPFAPCNSSHDGDDGVCLNASHWADLHTMATKSGSDFLFGVSFDMVAACEAKAGYSWDPAPSAAMIKWALAHRQSIWGFELGNEVNNRAKSCGLEPAQQAEAFAKFAGQLTELYPEPGSRPKLLGPDLGYLDPEYWLRSFLSNLLVKNEQTNLTGTLAAADPGRSRRAAISLYAVTYHVYSWLSHRNYDFAMPIDNAARDGEDWYVPLVRSLAPEAQVWAGEDGPISGGEDGTCGGVFPNGSSTNTSVCGTYATVPWYANDLGSRAARGFKQYLRQDLIGGRYGLLGIGHDNEMLGPTDPVRINPDFWVNFMWKRVMGSRVFNATAGAGTALDPSVRAYAHCGVPPAAPSNLPDAVRSADTPTTSPMGIVLININVTATQKVQLGGGRGSFAARGAAAAPMMAWTLSMGADGVFGELSLLNGVPLQRSIADGKAIDAIPVPGTDLAGTGGIVELPPFSVTFVVTECPKQE